VFVLTDGRGWPVYGFCTESLATMPDPMVAVRAGCSWLDQDVALVRLKQVMNLHPGWVLGLAAVELVLGIGGWEAASIGGLRP
jgi:hypothetical protein